MSVYLCLSVHNACYVCLFVVLCLQCLHDLAVHAQMQPSVVVSQLDPFPGSIAFCSLLQSQLPADLIELIVLISIHVINYKD